MIYHAVIGKLNNSDAILGFEGFHSRKKLVRMYKEYIMDEFSADDKKIEVGAPLVSGAKVEAQLIKNGKNRTILIFKKRRRKNSRRKNGHRQQYSLIKISKIFSKDGSVISETKKITNPTKETIKKKRSTKER